MTERKNKAKTLRRGEGVEDANINGQNQKEEEKQRQTGRRGEVKGKFGHHLFAKSTNKW